MKYMSTSEAAAKWNLSKRRVIVLCNEGRINDAQGQRSMARNLYKRMRKK